MALRLLGIIVTESARNAVSAIRALNARALCLLGVQGLLLEFLDVIFLAFSFLAFSFLAFSFLAFSFLAFLLLALRAKYRSPPSKIPRKACYILHINLNGMSEPIIETLGSQQVARG